jgi:predicted nucleic acid-binding protein
MAASVIVDASFLVALLSRSESSHRWADAQAKLYVPPWQTCESALSEAFHLLGATNTAKLTALIQRKAVVPAFHLADHAEPVFQLMQKYSNVPISLADACLVRMTEVLPNPILLTTDSDFRVYRRHSRQSIPCVLPR